MKAGAGAGAWLLLAALVLILICLLLLDRPLALLMHGLFHHSPWFLGLAAIGQIPLTLAPPALAAAAFAAWCGWRPAAAGWLLITIALAVTVTIAFKDLLKAAFGRTWPETWVHGNPSLIRDHVYGFAPFHGGEGWSAFPSGHTAAIGAVAGVLWWRLPRLRWLWALLVALTGLGLVAGNFHFLGDVVAGATLGVLCGRATLALPLPKEDRPAP